MRSPAEQYIPLALTLFAAIGRWVAKVLNEAMKDVLHVIRDTMELIVFIKTVEVE